MNIIAKLSFWILQPPKKQKTVITNLSFEDIILGALGQFRIKGYVNKLRTSITQESLPLSKDDLLEFLCNQIAYT